MICSVIRLFFRSANQRAAGQLFKDQTKEHPPPEQILIKFGKIYVLVSHVAPYTKIKWFAGLKKQRFLKPCTHWLELIKWSCDTTTRPWATTAVPASLRSYVARPQAIRSSPTSHEYAHHGRRRKPPLGAKKVVKGAGVWERGKYQHVHIVCTWSRCWASVSHEKKTIKQARVWRETAKHRIGRVPGSFRCVSSL